MYFDLRGKEILLQHLLEEDLLNVKVIHELHHHLFGHVASPYEVHLLGETQIHTEIIQRLSLFFKPQYHRFDSPERLIHNREQNVFASQRIALSH